LTWLDNQAGGPDADETVASVRALYAARARRLELAGQPLPSTPRAGADELRRYLDLRLALLGVERSTLVALRRQGRISATVLRGIERKLDLEEARLRG
jgi:hypothetical protein